MIQGETKSYNGYEVCLFPMDYVYPTQSYHGGTASDWIGSAANYPVYAPFTCEVYYVNAGDNTIWAHSVDKVWTPYGLTYVTVCFTHSNDIAPAPFSIGDTFNQGDLMYHTGNKGQSYGDHLHLDQASVYTTYIQAGGGLYEGRTPFEIYYLSGSETIFKQRILDYFGEMFKYWKGFFKWYYSKKLLERRKYGL